MHLPIEKIRLEETCLSVTGLEETMPIEDLVSYTGNARIHSKKQIEQIASSIKRFGFTNPVLIVAGHGRVEAAKLLGMSEVPVRRLAHLNKAELRAYVLADNKIAENAGWDAELLRVQFEALIDLEFDLGDLGFSMAEIDLVLEQPDQRGSGLDPVLDKQIAVQTGPAVTKDGDVWLLGKHRWCALK